MKPSREELDKNPLLLRTFNEKQIEAIRAEATNVKECFTTHAHQAMMVSAAIFGVGVSFVRSESLYEYGIFLASVLVAMLCITTARVGCHKYNTFNRNTGYQIHLARILDYAENNDGKENVVARELRRIDWEEAMFAWRVVQPIIYEYFYRRFWWIGLSFCRFGWLIKHFLNPHQLSVQKKIEAYPWYDSRVLLLGAKTSDQRTMFYPGTYLRKMLLELHFISLLSIVVMLITFYDIANKEKWYFYPFFSFTMLVAVYIIFSILVNHLRCRILESGLLSIQTSAFVWRIVCISHLVAKMRSVKRNRKPLDFDSQIFQIYNGYTCELGGLAAKDLRENLHNIHDWLEKKEQELLILLKDEDARDYSGKPDGDHK